MRAAPVFSGRSWGSECETPSGKSAMAPPAASSARQRAKLSSLREASAARPPDSCARWIGMLPKASMARRLNGFLKSVPFARKRAGEPVATRRTIGSRSPFG